MRFTKMEGLGNDYLYVYGPVPDNVMELSRRLSDHHFGPGADGMIYIYPTDSADFSMRIFNADGSEAKMCGNGIRCVGKYVYDKGYTKKTELSIATLSGIRNIRLFTEEGRVKNVSVDMGQAKVEEERTLYISDREIHYNYVSVGNPHSVVFVDDIDSVPVGDLGRQIESNSAFPDGINVEFVKAFSGNKLRLKVWERGSGITMACGTGACAASAAAIKRGLCDHESSVSVILDGGVLNISTDNAGEIVMTGPANTVYEGEIEI